MSDHITNIRRAIEATRRMEAEGREPDGITTWATEEELRAVGIDGPFYRLPPPPAFVHRMSTAEVMTP